MKTLIGAIVLFSMFSACAKAEEQKADPQKPKTKLQAFEAQVGSVIIRGFSAVGTVRGEYSTSVAVESREFTNAASGKKEYGVGITVTEGGSGERDDTSYIDYDEIEPLIKGIDYISQIKTDVTPLENFQADYRTRGDLLVTTYSSSGSIAAAVVSGTVGAARSFLTLEQLAALRALLVTAKQQLDGVKKRT